MAIDTSIIGRLMPAQFKVADPLETAQRSLALQGLMGQQDLQGLQLDEARRGADASQRLQALFGSNPNATPEDVMRIDPTKGLKMRQDLLTNRKTEGDIAKTATEVEAAKAKQGRDLIASANPQNYPGIIAEGRRLGQRWANDAPPEFDPNWQRQNVIGADKWLEVNTPKIEFKSDNKTNRAIDMNPFTNPNIGQTSFQMQTTPGEDLTDQRTRAEGAANRGVTMRGQNMSDSRSREANNLTRDANATTYDAERGVLVNRATGEARPAMLGGQPIGEKDKPLNDAQAKALLFSNRMAASDKIINELSGKGTNVSVPGSRSGILGSAINAASPESQQSLDQAKRDFINAVLRRESGAVIAESEFANAEKQYFPQVGENANIIAQKAANRKNALDSIIQEVPERKRTQPRQPSTDGPRIPTIKDDAGYNALPSGASFIAPDGTRRRKP